MRTTMGRRAYPSDLTDEQWALLEPLIPRPSLDGRPAEIERREIVNGILYVLRTGCVWRYLPHEFPAWGTVYYYFRRWEHEGIWEQVLQTLRMQMRRRQGRDPEPSAAIIDSQSIKTGPVRGAEKSYDPGKKIWGRKRHVLVDTQGHLLAVKVSGADQSDLEGAKRLLAPLRQVFPRLKHLWGDTYYAGSLIDWLKTHLGWTIEIVRRWKVPARGILVPIGEEPEWDKLFPSGFRALPRRWVVERTLAWIIRWRRLCRDHEGLPESSEAFIKLAASRRMLSLLAPGFP
jgi:putative transposase